jgi:hypothetical protein
MAGFATGLAGSAAGIAKKLKSKMGGNKSSASSSSSSSDADNGWDTYHKGGLVRKTGPAMLKKGERVLTKRQQKGMRKRMRGK